MLESGCVSVKNEVNIMMKNIVDIVLGGCKFSNKLFSFSFDKNIDRMLILKLLIGCLDMECHSGEDH